MVKLEFICQKLASSKVEDREDMPITRIYLSEIQMEGLDEVTNSNLSNRRNFQFRREFKSQHYPLQLCHLQYSYELQIRVRVTPCNVYSAQAAIANK